MWIIAGCMNSAKMNESSATVKHISPADFTNEVVDSKSPVVVDFYATWCGPCRALSPMLDAMSASYTNKVKFVKVNLDEAPDLAKQYSVEAIPTLLFFKNGQVVDRTLGLMDESALKARLDAFSTN